MQRKITSILSIALLTISLNTNAQDDLINKVKGNKSENSKASFTFKEVINIERTPIKNQGSSGTCWSYSGNSFIESEMIRMGKAPIELSQIYTARNAYIEKGIRYVRMHGAIRLGEGGAFHDVLNTFEKYGTLPQSLYTGLSKGQKFNNFSEMTKMLEAMLKSVISNKKLSENWLKAYTSVIDTYLGEVPKTFKYEGKTYTPQSFAKKAIGINPDDYREITSFKEHDYYKQFTLLVPDNWSYDSVWNVKMNDLVDIVDNALKKGYSVAWAGDVSEKGFSWKNGIAYVPEMDYYNMNYKQRKTMFNGPKPEKKVTADDRQKAFDNYETTDDHGMQIVGIAKDQNNKEYYIVKNSWGKSNDYKGYLYMTKTFMKYKATNILVHKDGVPSKILRKFKK